MCTSRRSIRKAYGGLLGLALFAVAGVAFAQDAPPPGSSGPQDDPPSRVARLSYLRGDVSFQPAGNDDWVQADLNRPLGTGDKLYTDHDSRAEMEVGAATVRLDSQASFDILNLNDTVAQTELTEGIMNLHVRRVFEGQSYEVDTPTLAFVITQPGDYRVDIAPDGTSTMVSVFSGSGDVYGENNASYSVRAGSSYRFNDSSLHDYEVVDLPQPDDFDNWVASRNNRYDNAKSRQYVSQEVIGYADLDDYGGWDDTPEYGHVWYPTTVETGWAPYRYGHWSWIDPWGWSWVDNASWGFAPFHYGRWVMVGSRWGWCPGPIAVRPVYAPALVAFVGGGGFSVGIGAGGPVGWFPLGPRDVYVPWYHASRNYFTNVNVRNTTIINNTYITNVYNNYSRGGPITNVNYAYRNANAVTAVSRETFVGARAVNAGRVAINEGQLRNANVVTRVGIAPERQSFVAANAARARAVPTAATLNRGVIARTPPPPRPAPVATRLEAIKKNNDQPLATQQLRRIAAPAAVATGAAVGAAAVNRGGVAARQGVTLVGQGAPKTPQPLPLRGTANGAQPATVQRGTTPNTVQRGVTPNTVQRGPVNGAANNVHAPQTGTPATVQRGTATQQTGNGMPSSRFAPHPGQPATTTNRTTGAGATNNGNATNNNPRGTTTTTNNPRGTANGNPTTPRTMTTTPRTVTPSNNGVTNNPRGSGNPNVERGQPPEHTVQRRTINSGNGNGNNPTSTGRGGQPTYQPRTNNVQQAPSRSVQEVQQPKTPQTYQRATPPPPQVHNNPPPQPRVERAPVERRAPPPEKKKDDKDNGGHR